MFVLRILNGPLFGTEVVVPSEGCFVRVVDLGSQATDISIEQGIDLWANGTVLTIPLAGTSPNFRLIPLTDEQGEVTLRIEAYDTESDSQDIAAALNAPVSIGALQIAVRVRNDVWSDAVLRYRGGQALIETVSLPEPIAVRVRPRWQWLAGFCSAFVGAGGLATLVWLTWPASAPAADVKSLLTNQAYRVVEGNDQHIYVFVRDSESVGSTRRQLARAGAVDVRLRVSAQEVARIGRWLESIGIQPFSIDLNDLRNPVLRLRETTNSRALVPADFDARLLTIVPYSRTVKVQWHSDIEAQDAAKFLVEEIGAQATYRETPNHFVAAVDDHLSDAQLDAFSRALTAYQRVWGKEYAQFEINQRDLSHIDGLKTGQFNYELRSARHVYFPPTSAL